MKNRILLVDDDSLIISSTRLFLEKNGFEVTSVSNPSDMFSILKAEEFPLVLLDFNFPETHGDEILKQIKTMYPKQQVAIYSCDKTRETLKKSFLAGAVDFIDKNDSSEILEKINLYCNRYHETLRTIRITNEKNTNRDILKSVVMIGQSDIMVRIAEKIKIIASAGAANVFISGESGTGKELVAEAIHKLSQRKDKALVKVNCPNLSDQLLESELFGHRKGSFTGAISDKIGKFEVADKGTIFLDEIGDLSPEMQAKLLRVIQEKTIEPVGATKSKNIDVRIITATHKDIEKLAEESKFREDLMYRIKVLEIKLPPLRERTEDIELLVAYFTDLYNKKHSMNKRFQAKCLEVFRRYSWPGNIRELASVIEKHLIESTETIIQPEDLDLKFFKTTSDKKSFQQINSLDDFEMKQKNEKLNFIKNIVEHSSSKAEAARRLGISPTNLQYALKLMKKTDSK